MSFELLVKFFRSHKESPAAESDVFSAASLDKKESKASTPGGKKRRHPGRRISQKIQNILQSRKKTPTPVVENAEDAQIESSSSVSSDVLEESLMFTITPQIDLDRELDAERKEALNFCSALDEEQGMLAVSRTPSFNIMLYANDFYSDSCTILKKSDVRIAWEDIANNGIQEATDTGSGERQVGKRSSIIAKKMKRQFSSITLPVKAGGGVRTGGSPRYSGTSTITLQNEYKVFIRNEKVKEWLKHFKDSDPRYKILKFFNDVANEGATGHSVNFNRDHVSPLLNNFDRASVFTVWRPTSLPAIRRMMLGEGVGKGLDIKGKSAKRGKLSAFVPFLQIFDDEDKARIQTPDKARVRTPGKDKTIRIFFCSERARKIVVKKLNELASELQIQVQKATLIIDDQLNHDEETTKSAFRMMTLHMNDPTINIIDTYAASNKYGIEVQERLFWEGMVIRQSIYREPGSDDDTGRASIPSFQDMNFSSLREPSNSIPHTRAVILQYDPPGEENNNPMSPLNLIMAYEENDSDNDCLRVVPVVSDFDCFTIGTRGVKYTEEVAKDQVEIVKWMTQQTEHILDTQSPESWTKRWLDVLKECGTKGFYPKIPPGGYSDPKTGLIFKHAINRLNITGCVRHGAECFNYSFPQDLDEEVLVISDQLPSEYKGCNWVYVNQNKLKEILKFKIESGYTFPLNPKWVLCDQGWKEVYDKLMASHSPNVQDSVNCFYPPESGLRELIERVHNRHPEGFQQMEPTESKRSLYRLYKMGGTHAMDLAEQELKYYWILQRAKKRLRVYNRLSSILNEIRRKKSTTKLEEDDDFDYNDVETRVI